MTLSVLLIASLTTLYLLAMLFLWHSVRGQNHASTPDTELRFALKEGQTIVGVGETTEGIYFSIGDYEDIHESQDK